MHIALKPFHDHKVNTCPEEIRLNESIVINFIESLGYYTKVKNFHGEGFTYNLESPYLILQYFKGWIMIYYDKADAPTLAELQKVADGVGGVLLINPAMAYPIEKIRAAQEKMAKLDAMRGQVFHNESFGVNNMWIAFEASREEVLWYFDKENNLVLEGAKYSWKKAISMMYSCEGIFVFEYKKWTFVAGIKTEILFGCPPSSESISEKCHVSKLLEWGKRFNELQFYQHYDRSTFFNAFYRIHAKKIVYGEYETESYNKTYGAKPDGIIKMPSNEAYNAAGVWSIDPDTLRFEPELKNAKPWIMNIKQNT